MPKNTKLSSNSHNYPGSFAHSGEQNIAQHSLLSGIGERSNGGQLLPITGKGNESEGKIQIYYLRGYIVVIQTTVFGSSFVFSFVLYL